MIRVGDPIPFGAGASLGPAWSTERDFSWSLGHASTLTLATLPGPGDLHLELRLAPCIRPPHVPSQRLRVRAAGHLLADHRLYGETTLRLAIPPELAAGPTLSLALEHPDAMRPSDFGDPDARPLAFRFWHARFLRAPAAPAATGPNRLVAEHRFGGADAGPACLEEGWGTPEDEHSWALGHRSTLTVPVPDEPGPFRLLIELDPWKHETLPQGQRLTIGLDDRLLATLPVRLHAVLGFDLPPPAPGRRTWRLAFDHLDGARPREFGHYADGRNFVFRLITLRLIRLGDASPPVRPPSSGDIPPAELVQRFESLGCTCDFGRLQRSLGAERLTLLHMTLIPPFGLVRGLAAGFFGLGNPAHLYPFGAADSPNWRFRETAYMLEGQSNFPRTIENAPRVARQLARVLPFLVQRFFEDLGAAHRIYLLRPTPNLRRPEVDAIEAALRLYGDATLLWLTQDSTIPPGEVIRLGPHLLAGGLDHDAARTGSTPECWLRTLEAAAKA